MTQWVESATGQTFTYPSSDPLESVICGTERLPLAPVFGVQFAVRAAVQGGAAPGYCWATAIAAITSMMNLIIESRLLNSATNRDSSAGRPAWAGAAGSIYEHSRFGRQYRAHRIKILNLRPMRALSPVDRECACG